MGAEKLISKIEQDAMEAAEAVRAQAQDRAQAIREEISAETTKKIAAIEAASVETAAEIDRRRMLVAGLEARKNALASRREILDQAFDLADGQLRQLTGDAWESLILAVVLESVETGDELLRVPEKDRAQYEKSLLKKINTALQSDGRNGNLKLDDTAADFEGGVQIIGEKSDVNCSFEALIKNERGLCENKVAALLFESEV